MLAAHLEMLAAHLEMLAEHMEMLVAHQEMLVTHVEMLVTTHVEMLAPFLKSDFGRFRIQLAALCSRKIHSRWHLAPRRSVV